MPWLETRQGQSSAIGHKREHKLEQNVAWLRSLVRQGVLRRTRRINATLGHSLRVQELMVGLLSELDISLFMFILVSISIPISVPSCAGGKMGTWQHQYLHTRLPAAPFCTRDLGLDYQGLGPPLGAFSGDSLPAPRKVPGRGWVWSPKWQTLPQVPRS